MSRKYAQIKVGISSDDWFTQLGPIEQCLYFHLLASPDLELSGVIRHWMPEDMEDVVANVTPEQVQDAITRLAEQHYIIIDTRKREVFIRSFQRNDASLRNGKLYGVGIRNAHQRIKSKVIRGCAIYELQRLKHDKQDDPEWAKAGWAGLGDLLEQPAINPLDVASDGIVDAQVIDDAPVTEGTPPF